MAAQYDLLLTFMFIWYWSETEALCLCKRGEHIYQNARERPCVTGAGRAAACSFSQLHFYEEPSSSYHSAGGHLHPPELQWSWVPLSVSISSNSHLFGTRTLVPSMHLNGETEDILNIHIINVQFQFHDSLANTNMGPSLIVVLSHLRKRNKPPCRWEV